MIIAKVPASLLASAYCALSFGDLRRYCYNTKMLKMDKDIRKFVDNVEAVEPDKDSNESAKWRKMFKRPNYFLFKGEMMVVKISRSKRPFWGIGKKYIDLLSCLDDYLVVLLISEREGWVFSKNEVSSNISSKRWNLRKDDNNYKINFPLPGSNSFSSPSNFLKRFE